MLCPKAWKLLNLLVIVNLTYWNFEFPAVLNVNVLFCKIEIPDTKSRNLLPEIHKNVDNQ